MKGSIKKLIFIVLTAAITVTAVYSGNVFLCRNLYDDMNENCSGLNDLSGYIDYSMLSSELKELIDKRDFNFTTDEQQLAFCRKYENMDHTYTVSGSWNNVYPTDKSDLYDKLSKEISIDGTKYMIYVSLVLKPGTFLRPEIVDLKTGVSEI